MTPTDRKPYFADDHVRLYHGDALDVLRDLPDESVDCCVTSPPYFGLRDYGEPGQYGLEATPAEYVETMRTVFAEVRRVLAMDGTLWLNIADSYWNGPRAALPLAERDAAWLAALLDGEGCVQVHQQRRPDSADSFQCDVSVGMMVPEMVREAHRITGLGSVTLQNRGVWDWSVRGQQAADLLLAVYPHLLIKKRQAALTIALADDLAVRRFGRGNPATAEALAHRAAIKQAVSDLNQRRPITMAVPEPRPVPWGLRPKSLMGIPWRLAHALQVDDWILRNAVVWDKPNAMPESVSDRLSTTYEFVFLLAKSERYWFDLDAIREPLAHPEALDRGIVFGGKANGAGGIGATARRRGAHRSIYGATGMPEQTNMGPTGSRHTHKSAKGRNPGDVWNLPTQPFPAAHFAVMVPTLAERCILAGCKPGGVVLDPFCGSGTTGMVAGKLGRRFVGIDLSKTYLDLALRTRLNQAALIEEVSSA